MNDQSDSQLLHAYAKNGSEAAFAELVRRYIDFVYSAARRMVCDPHLAEDVTQAVFAAFAKNAQQLADRPVISGWLHRTSQNIAAQTVRTIERRRAREQEAVAMNELFVGETDSTWEQIAPQLDQALGELSETDRDAVLLRYFERKSAREIAQVLSTSEEAAQKRVNRAVERLRDYFTKRNVTIGVPALIALISANGMHAAPAALVTAISSTAATAAASTSAAASKTIAMTTLQKTVIGTALAAAIGIGIYEARQASHLRNELKSQRSATSTEQIEHLKQELANASKRLAILESENAQLKSDTAELARLRGEIGRLRDDSRQLANLKTNTASDATLAELLLWRERVTRLKQYLERNPAATIAELQFASERDWLDVARDPFESEADFRSAMSQLRQKVELEFARRTRAALRKYMEANGKQFPSDVSQLQSYFEKPGDAAMLQRYGIFPKDQIPGSDVGNLVISPKEPVDRVYDQRTVVGAKGYNSVSSEAWQPEVRNIDDTLAPVMERYAAANGELDPTSFRDVLPYLKTAEEKTALQKVIEQFMKDAKEAGQLTAEQKANLDSSAEVLKILKEQIGSSVTTK